MLTNTYHRLALGLTVATVLFLVLGINAMYAALFSLSAWLFWRAAEEPSVATSGMKEA